MTQSIYELCPHLADARRKREESAKHGIKTYEINPNHPAANMAETLQIHDRSIAVRDPIVIELHDDEDTISVLQSKTVTRENINGLISSSITSSQGRV
jgi:hypothetical protein